MHASQYMLRPNKHTDFWRRCATRRLNCSFRNAKVPSVTFKHIKTLQRASINVVTHNCFLMMLLMKKTRGQTEQHWSLVTSQPKTPKIATSWGYFTTSMRVWHGAHHSRTQELQKYIQRSNQECPQSDETPKFGPIVCQNCRFPLFKRRACSKLSCALKVYVQCVKEDVCARKTWSTERWMDHSSEM